MVDDQTGSPTWARWLARATADVLRKCDLIPQYGGTYHLAAAGHVTRYELANAIINTMKDISGDPGGWAKLSPITTAQYPLPARRPRNPVMSKDKVKQVFGVEMSRWESQLRSCLVELSDASHRGAA